MHLSEDLVPLSPSFADKVGLHDLCLGLFLCLLEIFLSSLDSLFLGVLFRGVFGRVELLVEEPQLVILDRCDSPEGFLYVLLHLLPLQKLLDRDDMSDVALMVPDRKGTIS